MTKMKVGLMTGIKRTYTQFYPQAVDKYEFTPVYPKNIKSLNSLYLMDFIKKFFTEI